MAAGVAATTKPAADHTLQKGNEEWTDVLKM